MVKSHRLIATKWRNLVIQTSRRPHLRTIISAGRGAGGPPLCTNDLVIRTANNRREKLFPHSLKQRALVLNHHTVLHGISRRRYLYYRVKQHFYWPLLAVNRYATFRNCQECAGKHLKIRKDVCVLKSFPTKKAEHITRNSWKNKNWLLILAKWTLS